MKQAKHTWDSASKKVLNEAGLEKAPIDMLPNIMDAIAKAGLQHIQYKPLISKRAWLYIGLVVTAIFAIIVFGVPFERYYFNNVDLQLANKLDAFLGELKISKTLLYSIGFLGLFIVQIPFLKRLLDKQYK